MDDRIKHRMMVVEMLAGENLQYRTMLQENAELERKFNVVLSELTTEQVDIICDFLMHCETMSDRMLELVCMHMRFQWER